MARTHTDNGKHDDALRRKAEALLQEKTGTDRLSPQDQERLLHELSVHQIELELQNEELRNALVRAETAEERYFRLYELAPTGYAGFAPDGTITDINLAGVALLGKARNACVGRRFGMFVALNDLPAFNRFLSSVFSGTEKISCEVAISPEKGSGKILRIEGIRADTGSDRPVCRAALVDITELRKMETNLRLTNRKLSLLTGVTRHDIRNQLLMLSGILTLSQGSLDDPEKTRDFIRKELAITETIGRQILFTRDYESLGTRDPSWQNIGGLVREAAATINTGEVRVETAAADFEMYADPLLGKVFYNLIDNALRYGGSAMTTIRVSAVPSGTGLIVVFEDNGAGIPAEEKSRIFERGYGKNTGLGLFLAREILDLTGCTITETGNAGQGARFEIRVPAGDFRPVAGARRPGFSPAPDQFHPPLVR